MLRIEFLVGFALAFCTGCSVSDSLIARSPKNCSIEHYEAGNQSFGEVTVANLGEAIDLTDLLMDVLKRDHEEIGGLLWMMGEDDFRNSEDFDEFLEDHVMGYFPSQPTLPDPLRVCFIDEMIEGDQIYRFTQTIDSSTARGVALYRESRIIAVFYLSIVTI